MKNVSSTPDLALAPQGNSSVAEAPAAPPTPMHMLQDALKHGITGDNAVAIREIAELAWKFEDRNAKVQFNAAFVALQAELPRVKATKIIPGKAEGSVRSSFAPYEEIMEQIGPMLKKHGFTVSFANAPSTEAGRICKVCILKHIGGHEERNPFQVRIGSGPPGCNETQSDGAASSFAKRYALCDALNIVIEGIDNDARVEGKHITPEKAAELEHRCKMVNADIPAFLKLAGAPKFSEIMDDKVTMLEGMLTKKEGKR
jgi:ERF superfamily